MRIRSSVLGARLARTNFTVKAFARSPETSKCVITSCALKHNSWAGQNTCGRDVPVRLVMLENLDMNEASAG